MEAIGKHNTASTNQEHDVSGGKRLGAHTKTSESQGVQTMQLGGTDSAVQKVAEQSYLPEDPLIRHL